MKKAVVDTNILVSASFWKGNPFRVMRLAFEGKIEVFTSTEILLEYSKVLKRDFKLNETEVQERIDVFVSALKLVKPKNKINLIKDDPDDNKVLEAAFEADADYIVSGDKHLLKLKEFNKMKIVKPKEFLERIK
ncbi:putative toxin-antitoxin system toxin component, PIN family [Candidatus Micrarchaeota archaeon]|nr:putative toxin-antitoxin system toxin component, PIN family [Candidatus Micrarchaeota archaeon]